MRLTEKEIDAIADRVIAKIRSQLNESERVQRENKCIWCGSTEDVERTWRDLNVEGHGEVVSAIPICRACQLRLENNAR